MPNFSENTLMRTKLFHPISIEILFSKTPFSSFECGKRSNRLNARGGGRGLVNLSVVASCYSSHKEGRLRVVSNFGAKYESR